jgi:diguanylate cyclase (GGDEF)-like protein
VEGLFVAFLDALPIFLCVADRETKAPIYCNPIAAECLGEKSDTQKVAFVQDVMRHNNMMKYCDTELEDERGRWFFMEYRECVWLNEQRCILITGADHSHSVTNEELLTVADYTDGMTGICNRKMGLEMLTKFVNEMKIGASPFTLCFLDLDDLKYINDNFGHSAGDQYIYTVVDVIKRSVRLSDIFARMGGDEFLIIFPKCGRHVVDNILQNVTKSLALLNSANRPRTCYSISYGILEVDAEEAERGVEELLMYQMKGEYKKTRVLPGV